MNLLRECTAFLLEELVIAYTKVGYGVDLNNAL